MDKSSSSNVSSILLSSELPKGIGVDGSVSTYNCSLGITWLAVNKFTKNMLQKSLLASTAWRAASAKSATPSSPCKEL